MLRRPLLSQSRFRYLEESQVVTLVRFMKEHGILRVLANVILFDNANLNVSGPDNEIFQNPKYIDNN